MPFVRLETSLDLPPAERLVLMRAIVACTARELGVPAEASRAEYALLDPADGVIGTGRNEPWVIAYLHMKAGRAPAVKGTLTKALFDLLVELLGVARGALRILIIDYTPEDWNNGGDTESTPH
jgi:phenylpyruvate tautomerase PptA (4-oxalocrotonate tautomerase family)